MTVLAVVFLAVSILSLTIQVAGLRRMLPTGETSPLVRRGMRRTATSRVVASATYVALAGAGLAAQNSFPGASLVVFTAVQLMWIVNARLDVQLRRRLDGIPPPPRRRFPVIPNALLDVAERVGWTFLQSLGGTIAVTSTVAGFNWQTALASAGAAAALSLAKYLAVQASRSTQDQLAIPQQPLTAPEAAGVLAAAALPSGVVQGGTATARHSLNGQVEPPTSPGGS